MQGNPSWTMWNLDSMTTHKLWSALNSFMLMKAEPNHYTDLNFEAWMVLLRKENLKIMTALIMDRNRRNFWCGFRGLVPKTHFQMNIYHDFHNSTLIRINSREYWYQILEEDHLLKSRHKYRHERWNISHR